MDKYSYTLKSFRAIKSANIDLNGITVLAGENGCGKSTLTRTLFYLIDVISHYDEYVFADFKQAIRRNFRRLDMIRREISMYFKDTDGLSLQRIHNKLMSNEYGAGEIDEIMLLYRDAVVYFAKVLEDYFATHSAKSRAGRLLQYVDMDPSVPYDSQTFIDSYMALAQQAYDEYMDCISRRDISSLIDLINDKYDVLLSSEKIQFVENDVRLLGTKQFGHLFNIQRAIYVDTPMALCSDVLRNPLWDHFNALISKKSRADWTFPEKKMRRRLQLLMHGSLKLNDDFFENELHYLREDNLDIPITQAATGLKSFAYILRLLENGLLNDATLLIIDEPEVHLHPQWVVEFARILVLLNKDLGVKVLIASHNPDMVAAIQAIARKEDCLEQVTYYQAKAASDFTYQYKKLGSEIGEIFKSFNVALERIQYYGTGTTDNQ